MKINYCSVEYDLPNIGVVFKYFWFPQLIAENNRTDYHEVMKALLRHFRYNRWIHDELDANLLIDTILENEVSNKTDAESVINFLDSDAALDEIRQIDKVLEQQEFYRYDTPAKAACLTALFDEKYDQTRKTEAPFENIYEFFGPRYSSIKPMSEAELYKIFKIMAANLSPHQSPMMQFYIDNLYRSIATKSFLTEGVYTYTDAEWLLIETGIKNIRNSTTIKNAINDAMDKTLF